MKRNCLCVFLALLLCLSLTVPTFAESDPEPPDRVTVPYSFGLKHVSGSTYKMKANVTNTNEQPLTILLALYDSGNNPVDSILTLSSDPLISLSKTVSLSPGTYVLQISIIGLNVGQTAHKTYHIS